jgi:hypothetical protein
MCIGKKGTLMRRPHPMRKHTLMRGGIWNMVISFVPKNLG